LIENTLLVLLIVVVDQYILVETIELDQSHNYDHPFYTKNQQINKSTIKIKYNNSIQSEKQKENNKITIYHELFLCDPQDQYKSTVLPLFV
jgi:hypothetical protein